MPYLPDSAVLIVPEVLTIDTTWTHWPAGILVPQWLDQPTPQFPSLVARFIALVQHHAPIGHRTGTIGGRIIDDPCEPGDWHADAHGAADIVRYVTTVHEDPTVACGQQFRAVGPLPSGTVAIYREAEHRRPRVPGGRRIFLSATTGIYGGDLDLMTCTLLQALTA